MSLSAPKHTSYPSAPNIVPFNCFFEGPLIPDPQVWGQLTTHSKSTPKQKKNYKQQKFTFWNEKTRGQTGAINKKRKDQTQPTPFQMPRI